MMEDRALEPADACQLDLFGLDRMKLGEGYAALSALDLDRAASIFNSLTLDKPDFGDAREGFVMAAAWSDILWEMETRGPQDSAVFLWEKIQSYDFGQWGNGLRKGLIKRLIDLIGNDDGFYVLPDLCLGFLHAELAEYERAEDAFRRLLERHPDDVRIMCRLGNSLFFQKKLSQARHLYAQALLAAPADVDFCAVEDPEVRGLVKECGPIMAPVYAWLRDILPLVDVADISSDDLDHEKALKIYHIITLAEEARGKGNHQVMVEQRRILKKTDPEVLEEYLVKLRMGAVK